MIVYENGYSRPATLKELRTIRRALSGPPIWPIFVFAPLGLIAGLLLSRAVRGAYPFGPHDPAAVTAPISVGATP